LAREYEASCSIPSRLESIVLLAECAYVVAVSIGCGDGVHRPHGDNLIDQNDVVFLALPQLEESSLVAVFVSTLGWEGECTAVIGEEVAAHLGWHSSVVVIAGRAQSWARVGK